MSEKGSTAVARASVVSCRQIDAPNRGAVGFSNYLECTLNRKLREGNSIGEGLT